MRSAVSVILSSPSSDPNMSNPDYEQTFHHHSTLLILVKHVGQKLSQETFLKVFNRINKIDNVKVKVADGTGDTRNIWARYVKDYPAANNFWGDFQTHRRVLGLVTVGECHTEPGWEQIRKEHESLKARYTCNLYESRCIVFGIPESGPNFTIPDNMQKNVILYPSYNEDSLSSLEGHISDFLSHVFVVLESKRHNRSREKIDRVQLLTAPIEKKEVVGIDMDTKNNKKRCSGRVTKHLGDLCLQADLPWDALTQYSIAVDTLRSINDLLWLGSACEGLCAASMCIRYPHLHKHPRDNSPSQDKSKNSMVELEPLSLPSITHSHNAQSKVLSNEDICKVYREAIIHYSKYKHAAAIEIECCFKAARVAAEFNKPLQVANFLQNIIYINVNLHEEEKITQLNALADLYEKIGFHRKASYYRRTAAATNVSAKNPQTNWDQCYNLMIKALPGHRLSLDPSDYPETGENGWGSLQKQVLQDVVAAANRVGHSSVATRHMTLLLQVMWNELSPSERVESSLQLQSLADQCEGSPIPLFLESGLKIPPANLIHIPTVESFIPHKLKPNLQPMKLAKAKTDYGPFLFTPLKFGSLERKTITKDSKMSYLWVAEEECEVKLELTNPLPFELEVSNMRLLTTGVVFETLPLTVTLPPEVCRYPITLTGTPKEVGELEISGYSTHTLGVKSNCPLKSLPKITRTQYTIEVVPALPLIEAYLDLGQKYQNSTTLPMFAGESINCHLYIENVGKGNVEIIEINIDSDDQVLTCNTSNTETQLPLEEGSKICIPLQVFAASNFVNLYPVDGTSIKSSVFSGNSSYPSLASYRQGNFDNLTSPTLSFSPYGRTGMRSGPSSLSSLSSHYTRTVDQTKLVESRVKIRYSGKPGLDAGYCRIATVTLQVEISNSIIISNWDVIPAETYTQFYMVLDMVNMTGRELEIKFAPNRTLLIEENESCRVPIPIDRCPLSKIGQYFQTEDSIKEIVDLNAACSEHIATLVEVEWVMGDRCGKVSLKGITLSTHMLDIVRMSPINWEILINGVETNNSTPSTIAVGECVQVSIIAHNALQRALSNLSLSFHFFQDYQNGTFNCNLDSRLAVAGPSHVVLDSVCENGSAKIESSIVFFNSGQYKMNVQCSSQARHSWKLVPPLEFNIKDV